MGGDIRKLLQSFILDTWKLMIYLCFHSAISFGYCLNEEEKRVLLGPHLGASYLPLYCPTKTKHDIKTTRQVKIGHIESFE